VQELSRALASRGFDTHLYFIGDPEAAPVERVPGMARLSRREMARRLGIATAIALPFIASINAPAAIQAASCGGGGAPCGGANPPCCANFICNNFSNMCQGR
jgi:hypothetical protein